MKYIISSLLLCITLNMNAQNNKAFLGKWLTEDKDSVIEFFVSKDGKYTAKIVELIPATDKNGKTILDKNNPNPAKRHLPVQGLTIFYDFEYEDGKLTKGKLYDPRTGKDYRGKIWIEDDELMVRGYIGFLYGTKAFSKVE